MADDDDAIYVDVKARLDEASADGIAERLKDKLKDAGDAIGKAWGSDIGKQLRETIGDELRDVAGDVVPELAGKAGGWIGQHAHDALKDFGVDVDKIVDRFQGAADVVRDAAPAIQKIGSAVDALRGHDAAGGIQGLTKGVTDLTHSLSGILPKDVVDTVDDFGTKINKVTDAIQAFKSHNVAGGLTGVSGLLGGNESLNEVAAMAQGVQDFGQTLRELAPGLAPSMAALGPLGVAFGVTGGGAYMGLNAARGALDASLRQDYEAIMARGGTKLSPEGKPLTFEQYTAALSSGENIFPTAPGVPGTAPLLGSPRADFDISVPGPKPQQPKPNEVLVPIPGGSVGTRGPQYVLAGPPPPAAAPPITSGSTVTQAQHATVTAGSATITAGSVSLGGVSLPSGYVPGSAGRGNVQGPASPPSSSSSGGGGAIGRGLGGGGTGGTGAMGGLWASGGLLPGPSPGHDNLLGSIAGTPVGLEGGEFVVNPEATQAYLPLLKAINMSHFDEGGQVPPQNTADPGGGGQGPIQQQGIGSGKGMSVGGGLLGAAEQAGAMMAGPFAPAAQVAEQEMNLAIQNTGKIIADLAMAPIETLWLGGGQLGAPKVGGPDKAGWMGKLLGGVIGEGTSNLQNLAGSVMKPKQPDQPGQQDIHQGPTAAPPAGPAGTQDDPMHVKNVGGQPGHPQGATSSWMNMQNPMLNQLSPG